VPTDGYRWWYIDALSADGQQALAIIAFVGSVFSPYYALARRRGRGDPLNFCALNIALYGPRRKSWAMTERGCAQVRRSASSLAIGPSTVSWDGIALTIRIEETAAPIPSPLRGIVRVYPKALMNVTYPLDASGRHNWQPIAPCSHVEVQLQRPHLCWRGEAYVDSNCGGEPIEKAFRSWTWSRADLASGTAVLYAVNNDHGADKQLALLFKPSGTIEHFPFPSPIELTPTRWGIARETFADENHSVRIIRTLENAPFYARTLISTSLLGQRALAVHESLSLRRFRAPWVQAMLPFRMPRALR
jgi:carotenoid 1,2-hydratase